MASKVLVKIPVAPFGHVSYFLHLIKYTIGIKLIGFILLFNKGQQRQIK